MLLVQKCINVDVRKLTPHQVMIPWAMGWILHHYWWHNGHKHGGVTLKLRY